MLILKNEMLIRPLFRGDALPTKVYSHTDPRHRGSTFANYFDSEGLMAKFCDGGQSKWMKKPLAYLVAAHVGFIKKGEPKEWSEEVRISNHSPFISFSESEETAFDYMDRSGKAEFEHCHLEEATHFMWKLSNVNACEIAPGHFRFTYKASIETVKHLLEDQAQRIDVSTEMGQNALLTRVLPKAIVASNTQADKSDHLAELIEVSTFLRNSDVSMIDPNVLNRALHFGDTTKEWLLFPTDPFSGGGYNSRFTLNKHIALHGWFRKMFQKAPPKKMKSPEKYKVPKKSCPGGT